jgi:hypothetical protein
MQLQPLACSEHIPRGEVGGPLAAVSSDVSEASGRCSTLWHCQRHCGFGRRILCFAALQSPPTQTPRCWHPIRTGCAATSPAPALQLAFEVASTSESPYRYRTGRNLAVTASQRRAPQLRQQYATMAKPTQCHHTVDTVRRPAAGAPGRGRPGGPPPVGASGAAARPARYVSSMGCHVACGTLFREKDSVYIGLASPKFQPIAA